MPLSRIKENRCRKNVIRQVDSKNEWLLLFAPNFTEKYALDFVLTLENAFSWRFHFKANSIIIGPSRK